MPRRDIPKLISRLEDLPPRLARSVSDAEREYVRSLEKRGQLPFGVTPFYASLAGESYDDPIRKQFMPDPLEQQRLPWELDDPLGEHLYPAAPRLVHQYHDRALLLSNGTCAGYCRHCFRRVWTGTREGLLSDTEISAVCAYLEANPQIKEILISGGDPLLASDAWLESLLRRLRSARPGMLLRICTRVPVTWPWRLDKNLLKLFKAFTPLRLIVHINHPRELALPVTKALSTCVNAGIPVHTQTVLLKGVNNDVQTLESLFREITTIGATPYYLFQGDLAPGTSHLRTSLREGLDLYTRLRQRVSALCLPSYAVDLPGGGGKTVLHAASISHPSIDTSGRPCFILQANDGSLWTYPDEEAYRPLEDH